jgi:hypothetical protein
MPSAGAVLRGARRTRWADAGTIDVGCLVEIAKGFGTYRRPAWTDHYTADHFAVLECNTETPAQMKKYVFEMADKKIGYCYIADAKEPNPWNRLPSYWETEVEAVLRSMRQNNSL